MRTRRLSALFWSTSILAFVLILYVVMDMSFKLPNNRPMAEEPNDSKWASVEDKIHHIEQELGHHQAVVSEIKAVVGKIADLSSENVIKKPSDWKKPKKSYREFGMDNVKKEIVKFNMETCAIRKETVPQTDVQMLSLYERLDFTDHDGGVWKQGWNVQYEESQWSSKNKLRVFIVPHSHNDPGWIKTFENYYKTQTRAIFSNMVEKLQVNPERKFIWAETSFLQLWWTSDATQEQKDAFKKLLNSGQIEIVTGGWVMNDEANSHWVSSAAQLTAGHQWLLATLGYRPRQGWAIDPFGHSAAQALLLSQAGLTHAVIQRVHYRLKKELARDRQLEFRWRQLWDGTGETDMFTHMMPFYSYDIPHTCGPDPKVCCQFDFKRLPGNGVTCPWNVPPRAIVQKNVAERSFLILDQWRKKAQLYRSNVVLVPLGDDFRYDKSIEWDSQFQNYEKIIDYINNNDEWNAEVQFGTLSDYFKAVDSETHVTDFPVLSGDMFTYADRNQHYWSGYYTSRPFYKSMDRALLAYLRAAETITAQAITEKAVSHLLAIIVARRALVLYEMPYLIEVISICQDLILPVSFLLYRAAETITAQAITEKAVSHLLAIQLRDRVESARRALALFQHHDGITGTSRDEVREDYSKKLLTAIKHSQSAIQQAAYFLLQQPAVPAQTQEDIFFDVDDIWRQHDELPTRLTITLDALAPTRRLVLYNALAFTRTDLVTVIVSSPDVEVFDGQSNPILAQVCPVVTGGSRLSFAANKYQLTFPVTVPSLGLVSYTVSLRDPASINKYTSFARVRVYNAEYWSPDLPRQFVVTKPADRLTADVDLRPNNGTRLVLTPQGLLKAVAHGTHTTPVHMDFVMYDSLKEPDNNSGAYLFLPSGPAGILHTAAFPELVLTEGPHSADAWVALRGPPHADILLKMSVWNNPALPQSELKITTTLMLDPKADDIELAMRLATTIDNGDVFYTDLNGMQMIKRRTFEKLPLQGNFYPFPGAAYIQDGGVRMTLITSTPLGLAALQPGQLEVMLDRRLSRDDNRGLNQGIQDNVLTRHDFRLILENANPCQHSVPEEHPSGQLTLGAHIAQQTLLQPLILMQYTPANDAPPSGYTRATAQAADVVLATFRSHVMGQTKEGTLMEGGLGLTFHRVYLETCYGNREITRIYQLSDGLVPLSSIANIDSSHVYNSSLTFTHVGSRLRGGVLTLCPMQIASVFVNINHTVSSHSIRGDHLHLPPNAAVF